MTSQLRHPRYALQGELYHKISTLHNDTNKVLDPFLSGQGTRTVAKEPYPYYLSL